MKKSAPRRQEPEKIVSEPTYDEQMVMSFDETEETQDSDAPMILRRF